MSLSIVKLLVVIVSATLLVSSNASRALDHHFRDLLDLGMVSRARTEYVPGSMELFDAAEFIPGRVEFHTSNSRTCDYAAQSQTVQTDSCIAFNDISFKVQLVADGCSGATVQYFHDSDCTLFAGSKALHAGNLACRRVSTDGGVTHQYASLTCHAGSEASAVSVLAAGDPSAEPTAAPTKTPAPTTTKLNDVVFQVKQTITGITLDEYNSNPINEQTLKQAVVSVLVDVTEDNLEDWKATEGSSRRRLASRLGQLGRGFATLADSIDLSYTVRTQSQVSSKNMQNMLKSATSDGTFNDNLHALAASNTASDLLDADSEEADTSVPDYSSNKLNGGSVAAIVIGVVFGVALLVLLAYYFVAGPKSTTSAPAAREGDYTVAL